MQCPTIKFIYLSFNIGFFFKYIFLMNFQPKILNFQMAIDLINVYNIIKQKIHQKLRPATLILKYYAIFHTL
jgi:hypothetical protein